MRAAVVCAWVLAGLVAGGPRAVAQPVVGAATRPAIPLYTTPLGIGMETHAYPYPVQFLPLEVEGEAVRMAFMDVVPTAPNGRAIVLLHGKNFYGGYFEPVIRDLLNAGYRVVVPDQIGFGKSSKPNIRYSFDLLAAHTAKLLDHLKVDKAAILGHSMGGMLAVRFARTYPRRTTHLVLENPIGLGDYPALGRSAAKDIPRCKLVELANVGHIPHLEAPERFGRVVVEFIGRND